MFKLFPQILNLIVVSVLLSSCQLNLQGLPFTEKSDELSGTLLVWHSWQGDEEKVLNDLLNKFTDIHPNMVIVRQYYPPDQIINEFRRLSISGLGPDILIAPADIAGDLVKENLIQDLQSHVIDPNAAPDDKSNLDYQIDTNNYVTAALDMLRDQEHLYGIPLSLNTYILYYNTQLLSQNSFTPLTPTPEPTVAAPAEEAAPVEEPTVEPTTELSPTTVAPPTIAPVATPQNQPAQTIADLTNQVNNGQKIAFPVDFVSAAWGIQAFGGTIFNKEGQVVLNQGGFANWLSTLKGLQDVPSVILNNDHALLQNLFIKGKVTYYIGNTNELSALQTAMGVANVGAVRLPSRGDKAAGPFLQAEAMLFNKASSQVDTELALRLGRYLTNVEQQREFALQTGLLPVHKRVKIDPRVSFITAEMIAQSRTATAITMSDIPKLKELTRVGDDFYQRVLAGEVATGAAAILLTEQINKEYGYEPLPLAENVACEGVGKIEVWHSLSKVEAAIFDKIKANFMKTCPKSSITLKSFPDLTQLMDAYREAILNKTGPAFIISDNTMIPQLMTEGLIGDINDAIPTDFLQRYIPQVNNAMRVNKKLHGLPFSMELMALYYNKNVAKDPPVVLDDLLVAASPETQLAIPLGFYESYWGLSAFGVSKDSPIFDAENKLMVGNSGLAEWLTWLKVAKEQSGIVLSYDKAELKTLFVEGTAAYLVGDSSLLTELQAAIGPDNLAVVSLPSGGPLLKVQGLMANPNLSKEQLTPALEFAKYVTSLQSQTLFMEQGLIPTNINVNYLPYPIIGTFFEQANASQVIPTSPQIEAVWEWGNSVYEQILDNQIDPVAGVAEFTDLVNLVNGFDITNPQQMAEFTNCKDEGEILLWHSWSEPETAAWQLMIDEFNKTCPKIKVNLEFVASDKLLEQLTTLAEAPEGTETKIPDFFMASHDLILPLQKASLIKDITSLIKQEDLVSYVPAAVGAVRYGDKIYGIPQSQNSLALYYNKDFIETPTLSFNELMKSSSPTSYTLMALNPDFQQAFWSASILNCQPCLGGQLLNERQEPVITTSDFIAWNTWLTRLSTDKDFILDTNQQTLRDQFTQGKVGYLVDNARSFNPFQAALGVAKVGVATLPVSDTVKAKPFLQIDAFIFNQLVNGQQTQLTLKFAQFANLQKNQTLLMQEANFVPTNKLSIAIIKEDKNMDSLISQAAIGILQPPTEQLEPLRIIATGKSSTEETKQ